jgi:hypothetical protein
MTGLCPRTREGIVPKPDTTQGAGRKSYSQFGAAGSYSLLAKPDTLSLCNLRL